MQISPVHTSAPPTAGAYLRYANLTDANLRSAVLTGANLTGANLTGANLTGARWPSNAPVPQGWARDRNSGLLKRAWRRGQKTATANP